MFRKDVISIVLSVCLLLSSVIAVIPPVQAAAEADEFAFIGADTTTAGLWTDRYGAEGVILPAYLASVPDTGNYSVPADGSVDYQALPPYLDAYSYNLGGNIKVTSKSNLNLSKSTILEPPSTDMSKVEAIAGGYAPIINNIFYSRKYYFHISDASEHTFTFYTMNYNQTVKLYAGVNTSLSGLEPADLEIDLSEYDLANGLYASFRVRGSFTLILSTYTPLYTGISGFFFGDPVMPTPTPTPTPDIQSGLLRVDNLTRSNWKGNYGSDGVILPAYLAPVPATGNDIAPADGSADYKVIPPYLTSYAYSLGGNIRVTAPSNPAVPEPPDVTVPKVEAVAGGYAPVVNGRLIARRYFFNINDDNLHQFTFYTWNYDKAVKIYKGTNTNIAGTEPADLEYDLSGLDVTGGLYVTFMIKGSFTLVLPSTTPLITGVSGFFFDALLEDVPQAPEVENLPARTVRLTWDNASGHDMIVERSQDGVNFEKIAAEPYGVNMYTDSGLNAGTEYFYRLRYASGYRHSPASEASWIATPAYQPIHLVFDETSIETTVDETIAIRTVLTDENGNPVPGRPVTFTLDGEYAGDVIPDDLGTVNTDSNGAAVIVYQAIYGGEYTLTAYTPDDDNAMTKNAEAIIPLTVHEPVASTAPVIFKTSEAVKPGDLLSLYGDGMQPDTVTVSLSDGRLLPIVQTDVQGHFLVVDVPDDIQADIFEVEVANSYGSTMVLVNSPDPRWILDELAFKGMTAGVYGRNLDASEFGAPKETSVRLVDAATGESYIPEIMEANPFAIRFGIHEPVGRYYVEVRTMAGKPWVRLPEYTLNIVEWTEHSDPLGLGVSWAGDFNWSNMVSAASVGIIGDGTSDWSDAINAQIDDIADNGGGVLFFPDGAYNFTQLKMRANVVIQGESKEGTVFYYIGTGGNGVICEPDAVAQGRFGFANLTFTTPDDSASITNALQFMSLGHPWGTPIQNLTASRIFIYNVNLDFSLTNTNIVSSMVTGASGKVLIANSSFKGFKFAPYSPYIKDELVVTNNTFDYTAGFMAMRAKRFVFENNIITGHYYEYPHQDRDGLHGLATNSGAGWIAEHNYWAGNTVQHIGTTSNDGESLLHESPKSNYLTGNIIRAEATTALIGIDLAVPGVNYKDANNDEWQIVIIDGKGFGQMRKLASMADNTITVEVPWDVVPDSTSIYTIVRASNDLTIYNNRNIDATFGVCFYMVTYDSVIADNTGEDIMAMSATARQLNPGVIPQVEPNYFPTIKRNSLVGKSWNYGTSYIGVNIFEDYNPSIAKLFGAEIKENTIDRAGHEDKFEHTSKQPAGIVLSYAYPVSVAGKGIYATVVEGNTVKNSQYGIFLAKGVSATTMKNNSWIQISGMDVYDEGSLDTVIVGGVPNAAPTMSKVFELEADEGQPLALSVDATDSDGDALVYSAANLPEGASFDPVSGEFSWTPGYNQAGSYQIHLYASDGYLTASAELHVTVNQAAALDLAETLLVELRNLDIKDTRKKLLISQLEKIIAALEDEKYQLAMVKLKVFLGEVKISTPKFIPPDKAEEILRYGVDICLAIQADAQGEDKSWIDAKTAELLKRLDKFKSGSLTGQGYEELTQSIEDIIDTILQP